MGKIVPGKKIYYLHYTVVFLVMSLLVFLPFILAGKSLVFYDLNQGGDGLVIHYNSFVYYGKYLRTILKTLITEKHLVIPMWDFSIGYGQDIIQTLWFYAIGDPFAFLSVFIPTKYSEIGYCAVTIFELYCAGLAFSFYARYMKKEYWTVLPSSMIYVFSSYPLLISTLHPYFTLPMILLPLLLVGAERLMNKKFDVFYIIMILISACACFYFFYMLCIFIALYALFRYFCTQHIDIKSFFGFGTKYVLNSLLGIAASAILLLPILSSLLTSNRVSASNFIPLLYPINYYQKLLMQVMVGGGAFYNNQGYTAFGLLSLVLLIIVSLKKREYRKLLIVAIVMYLFICIPYAAHVFNGFAYVTNRWIWAMDCFMAYLAATFLPSLLRLNKKEWKYLMIISMILCGLSIMVKGNRTTNYLINIIVLFAVILVISMLRERKEGRLHYKILPGMVCLAIILNAYLTYSPSEGNYIKYFGQRGEAYSDLTENAPGAVLSKIKDDGLFRFDTAGFAEGEVKRNSNMLLKRQGTSHYYSTNSGEFSSFVNDTNLNYAMDQTYKDLDRRSFLEALTGVKYIIIHNGKESQLPYGYDFHVISGDNYSVYASDNALPMAFTTSKLIDPTEFEHADAASRQEMLLQGIVLDGEEKGNHNYTKCVFTHQSLPYKVVDLDGVELDNGAAVVNKKKATLVLDFSGNAVSHGELYCCFKNLDYLEKIHSDRGRKKITGDNISSAYLSFSSGDGASESLHLLNSQNPYYCGHHDFLVNLGYCEEERSRIQITFETPGVYTFDSMEVVYQPMSRFTSMVRTLQEEPVQNLEISTNRIAGNINADRDKYVFLSWLYSPGWSAFIDNQKVDILKADSSFMAIHVPEGVHSLRMEYRTPLLREGAAVSAVSMIIIVFIYIIQKKKVGEKVA